MARANDPRVADYLVVNKPARLPTQAHESNATECVVGCAERGLGLEPGALRVTHRLDASTSGVVVLGKSKAAVAAFNASVHAERALLTVDPLKDDERSSDLPTDDEAAPRSSDAADGTDDSSGGSSAEKAGGFFFAAAAEHFKTYVALTRGASPLPLGSVTCWMYPGPFGADAVELGGVKKSQARPLRSVNVRGELRYKGGARGGWKRCRLVVLSCERAPSRTRAKVGEGARPAPQAQSQGSGGRDGIYRDGVGSRRDVGGSGAFVDRADAPDSRAARGAGPPAPAAPRCTRR